MESEYDYSMMSSESSLSHVPIGVNNTTDSLSRSERADLDDLSTHAPSDYEIDDFTEDKDLNRRKQHSVINGPIRVIPPEVMLLIFSQITEKAKLVPLLTVCKSWGDLIVEILWFRPTLDHNTKQRIISVMTTPQESTYWNYRQYIRRLNLSFIGDQVEDYFLNMFIGCINLERLTLVNCTKLSRLSISNVLLGTTKLQSVDLTGVNDISDSIFIAISDNCPRIQGLYAPNCRNVSNYAIIRLSMKCPLLKRVKISDNVHMTDEGLVKMIKYCRSLIEVDVCNCPNLSDHAFQKVFTDLDQIREFRVSHNQNVSDAIFSPLSYDTILDKLRIIDFTGCLRITDRMVERFVRAAPRLRNVVLSKCSNITDASLRSLAILGKNLHSIHLGHCTNITDNGVKELVRSCHRLQYIDLACCIQLTNLSVIGLANLPRLKRIGLVKCNQINDAGLLELIKRRGPGDVLERVHLSYCANITLYPIYILLRSCPRLTHLSLTGVSSFLRPDIIRFCRTAPPDFNENQRALFCVFSGDGVKQLRNYLMTLMNQLGLDNFEDLDVENTELENIQRLSELFFRPYVQIEEAEGLPTPLRLLPPDFLNPFQAFDQNNARAQGTLMNQRPNGPAGIVFDPPDEELIQDEEGNNEGNGW